MFIVDTFEGVSSPTAATEEAAVDTAFDRQLPSWTMPRLAIDSYLLAAATEEAAVYTALDRQLPFSSSNRMPLAGYLS
jgi:hypothetical protein